MLGTAVRLVLLSIKNRALMIFGIDISNRLSPEVQVEAASGNLRGQEHPVPATQLPRRRGAVAMWRCGDVAAGPSAPPSGIGQWSVFLKNVKSTAPIPKLPPEIFDRRAQLRPRLVQLAAPNRPVPIAQVDE